MSCETHNSKSQSSPGSLTLNPGQPEGPALLRLQGCQGDLSDQAAMAASSIPRVSSSPFGLCVEFESVDSTNAWCKRNAHTVFDQLVESSAQVNIASYIPVVRVVAHDQTAGIGQRDASDRNRHKVWYHAKCGGIAVTFLTYLLPRNRQRRLGFLETQGAPLALGDRCFGIPVTSACPAALVASPTIASTRPTDSTASVLDDNSSTSNMVGSADLTRLVSLFPLLTAIAICRTLESPPWSLTPKIKWINDILLEGAKVAGTLCEAGIPLDSGAIPIWFGIGLNVLEVPNAPQQGQLQFAKQDFELAEGGELLQQPAQVQLPFIATSVAAAWISKTSVATAGPQQGLPRSTGGGATNFTDAAARVCDPNRLLDVLTQNFLVVLRRFRDNGNSIAADIPFLEARLVGLRQRVRVTGGAVIRAWSPAPQAAALFKSYDSNAASPSSKDRHKPLIGKAVGLCTHTGFLVLQQPIQATSAMPLGGYHCPSRELCLLHIAGGSIELISE